MNASGFSVSIEEVTVHSGFSEYVLCDFEGDQWYENKPDRLFIRTAFPKETHVFLNVNEINSIIFISGLTSQYTCVYELRVKLLANGRVNIFCLFWLSMARSRGCHLWQRH